jgi:hypothetical protein
MNSLAQIAVIDASVESALVCPEVETPRRQDAKFRIG